MKINTKRIFCCESYALTLGIFELCRISNIFPQQPVIFIIEEYLKECPPKFEFPVVQSQRKVAEIPCGAEDAIICTLVSTDRYQ